MHHAGFPVINIKVPIPKSSPDAAAAACVSVLVALIVKDVATVSQAAAAALKLRLKGSRSGKIKKRIEFKEWKKRKSEEATDGWRNTTTFSRLRDNNEGVLLTEKAIMNIEEKKSKV